MKLKPLLQFGAVALLSLTMGCTRSSHSSDVSGTFTGDSDVSAETLRGAVEPLFDSDGERAGGETRALLILHDGKVVAERYAPGFAPDSRFLSWSVAKTVTAVMVGILVSDGRLSLDDPVPVPAWQQGADPRGAITLREMLTMTSGIAHRENDEPLETTDTLRMLVGDGAADMARYAENKPLAHAPGSTWQYDSATTLILSDMITRILTSDDRPQARRDAMAHFIHERLMVPVGLSSLIPEYDARGTMIGGAMMHMTARDYGRLGEFLRRGGLAGGRQVVSRQWVRFMTHPSAVKEGYGGHVWLNRPGAEKVMFVGDAPRSLYAANGLRGQYVIVSPAQGLTIVRLGVTSDDQMPALREGLARIIRKFPGG